MAVGWGMIDCGIRNKLPLVIEVSGREGEDGVAESYKVFRLRSEDDLVVFSIAEVEGADSNGVAGCNKG